jgi:ribosomal RNA assembly protein
MRIINIESMEKIRRAVPRIEDKIKINIGFGKSSVTVNGSELNEFLTEKIIHAIDFGFDVEDALLLKNEDFVLEFIDIKEHTNRKNLKDVRARVIGTNGKAKKTIEKLTGCIIVVKDNLIGLIVDSTHSDSVIQAIKSLIQGSKHGNVFMYLEKQNASKKYSDEDLGLRSKKDGEEDYEIINGQEDEDLEEDEDDEE